MNEDTPIQPEKEPARNSADYETIVGLAMRLPDEIMKYEKYVMALNRNIDGLNKRKTELETAVYVEVQKDKENYTNFKKIKNKSIMLKTKKGF